MNPCQRAVAKLDTEPAFHMHRSARQLRRALREQAGIMHRIEEAPRTAQAEVARSLGIPVTTAFGRLRSIRKHFRLTGTWHHRDNEHRPVHPSEKHRSIMELLAARPRMPTSEISRRTGTAVSTVHDRLKRIREAYELKVQWQPRPGGEGEAESWPDQTSTARQHAARE